MVQALIPSPAAVSSTISWEKLPDDFLLPDDPVDNIHQPTLAAALTDSLFNAGKLSENSPVSYTHLTLPTILRV